MLDDLEKSVLKIYEEVKLMIITMIMTNFFICQGYRRERGPHQHHRHVEAHRAQDGDPHPGAGDPQSEEGKLRSHLLYIRE